MGKVNSIRVIISGLAAGLVINIGEFILNEPILGKGWKALAAKYQLPEPGGSIIAYYVLMAFIMGIVLIWIYAAIRPRFGPGPRTAIIAGLLVWFLGWFWGLIGAAVAGIYPWNLVTTTLIWGFFEVPLAALAGGFLYKEE